MTSYTVVGPAADHERLLGAMAGLRRLADGCLEERLMVLIDDVDATLAALDERVLPHVRAEGSDDAEVIRHLVADLRRHRDALASPVVAAAVHEVHRTLRRLDLLLTLHLRRREDADGLVADGG
jgi:hypothetical protein